MEQLKKIAEEALKLAHNSKQLDSIESAIRIKKTVLEITEEEEQKPWIRHAKTAGPAIANYLAVLAFLLSMGTLIFQYIQFRKTIDEQRETFNRTQWREALKSISVKDDSSVLSSALQMESFFKDPDYSKPSRSLAVALLPLMGSGDQADGLWESMLDNTRNTKDQLDLISVARTVAAEEEALFRKQRNIVGEMNFSQKLEFLNFIKSPEEFLTQDNSFPGMEKSKAGDKLALLEATHQAAQVATSLPENSLHGEDEYESDLRSRPLKRAKGDEWKISSISEGFGSLWRTHGDLKPMGQDFSGVILMGTDFRSVDFSTVTFNGIITDCDLSETVFDRAQLRDAIIWNVRGFENSSWTGANWWESSLLSCQLATYLSERYPSPGAYSQRVKGWTMPCER